MNPPGPLTTRRDFFARTSDGLLGAALLHLLGEDASGAELTETRPAPFNLKPKRTHHEAKATSVIQLFMNGGPSQMDLFDPKPVLDRMDGQPFPGDVEAIGNQDVDDIGVMMGDGISLPATENPACGWPILFPIRPAWRTTSA